MFDLAFGLPVHVLVVHAVVVGVPVAALASVAVAVGPRSWRRAAPLVAVLDAGVLALVWVATQAGERLSERLVGRGLDPAVFATHAERGETLPWFALALLVAVALLAVLRRPGRGSGLAVIASVLVVVAAGAVVAQVVRVGHSGSSAVWGYLDDASAG